MACSDGSGSKSGSPSPSRSSSACSSRMVRVSRKRSARRNQKWPDSHPCTCSSCRQAEAEVTTSHKVHPKVGHQVGVFWIQVGQSWSAPLPQCNIQPPRPVWLGSVVMARLTASNTTVTLVCRWCLCSSTEARARPTSMGKAAGTISSSQLSTQVALGAGRKVNEAGFSTNPARPRLASTPKPEAARKPPSRGARAAMNTGLQTVFSRKPEIAPTWYQSTATPGSHLSRSRAQPPNP
mmetsp:Transcript_82101/g.235865  ORF Transcript_82101/g.235865 Transcript_82101/m.235865 type:complete len:237 (+) Transcript_82101:564-1274(+)